MEANWYVLAASAALGLAGFALANEGALRSRRWAVLGGLGLCLSAVVVAAGWGVA